MTPATTSTPIHLRYRPEEIEVTAEDPFKNDRLEREPFVTAATELLKSIQEPFVVALNAPWGSGKTTTFRMLEPNLMAAGVTTVSFNAWEVDYVTDPLVPLVAAVHDRLLALKGYGSTIDHAKVERLKALGSSLVKHGAIAAVKVATAGIVDLGLAADSIAKIAGEATAKAGEGLAEDVIDVFNREKQTAQQFRSLLEELIAYVRNSAKEGNGSPPLVLMIDELDRCRPTFAIAMLERIKHFFTVPGLVFVLALDVEQLKAITRKVYGTELDATEYLRRFIDLELRLPQADVGNMVNAMLSSCGADAFFAARAKYAELRDDRSWIVNILKALALHFDLSPRVVQRIISRLMLVVRQTSENHYLDPIIVVFMIFLRFHNEHLLKNFVLGRASASDVMDVLLDAGPRGQTFYDSHMGMLIEAYLLYAHKDQEYVAEFSKRAAECKEQPDSTQNKRIIDVANRYDAIGRSNFIRGGFDLREIDRRINLVATELGDGH